MAAKIKNTFVYLVQADNGEEYSEDRTEYTAGVFTTEEAAINFVKTTEQIAAGCQSVTIELWNASINERVGYFELEKMHMMGWARYNQELHRMMAV